MVHQYLSGLTEPTLLVPPLMQVSPQKLSGAPTKRLPSTPTLQNVSDHKRRHNNPSPLRWILNHQSTRIRPLMRQEGRIGDHPI